MNERRKTNLKFDAKASMAALKSCAVLGEWELAANLVNELQARGTTACTGTGPCLNVRYDEVLLAAAQLPPSEDVVAILCTTDCLITTTAQCSTRKMAFRCQRSTSVAQ